MASHWSRHQEWGSLDSMLGVFRFWRGLGMVSPARARPTGGAGSSGLMMPFMMPFDDLMPFAVYETQF